jgi:putative aminopeptidase FrvX
VGKQRLPGVIGARPIHLTTAEDREHVIPLESLRIDIGPRAMMTTSKWATAQGLLPNFAR